MNEQCSNIGPLVKVNVKDGHVNLRPACLLKKDHEGDHKGVASTWLK